MTSSTNKSESATIGNSTAPAEPDRPRSASITAADCAIIFGWSLTLGAILSVLLGWITSAF